ncbi:MAG: aspartate-semialdehyde dehydrogenase [Planctomycetes bacterium]|nr:aspartate-semialdehyde dehydrogenase [Planctomycetota bacterium]
MGVVGATGAVGRELLALLDRELPGVAELRLFASSRSLGKRIAVGGRDLALRGLEPDSFAGLDLVFFAAGAAVAREQLPRALAAGALVVDNSSAFRHDPSVPLVIPEVNPDSLRPRPRLVANPNCVTIIALLALAPIARVFGLESVVASTYQAVSGVGERGLAALASELAGRPGGEAFAAPILGNLIPQIGALVEGGDSEEERKLATESRKILGLPGLEVVCSSVRVPVRRAHTITLVAELGRDFDLAEPREVLAGQAELRLIGDEEAARDLNPLAAEGGDEVLVGRLRRPGRARLALVAIGDQLRRGAALNALRIARLLLADDAPSTDPARGA